MRTPDVVGWPSVTRTCAGWRLAGGSARRLARLGKRLEPRLRGLARCCHRALSWQVALSRHGRRDWAGHLPSSITRERQRFALKRRSLHRCGTLPRIAEIDCDTADLAPLSRIGGNLYSVPDTARRRVFDVHVLADEVRIFEDGALVATHAPLEWWGEKRLDFWHRKPGSLCRRSPRDPEPPTLRA